MNKIYLIGIIALFLLLVTSCTKEQGLEECVGALRLKFSFTLHTENEGNRFAEDADVVNVYFFNAQDTLCHIESSKVSDLEAQNTMDVKIAPGSYKIVAWASDYSDLSRSYSISKAEISKTSLSDFCLNVNGSESVGDPALVSPTVAKLDNLFYGAVGDRHPLTSLYSMNIIDVKPDLISEQAIDLIRYTNELKVTIKGIENLGLSGDYKVWITARNGQYGISNNNFIDPKSSAIKYIPFSSTSDATTFSTDFKMLRFMDDNQPQPMNLYIEMPNGKQLFTAPIDIIALLGKAYNPTENKYIYNSQSDYDRIYSHSIEFRIGLDLNIGLYINDWEVVDVLPIP